MILTKIYFVIAGGLLEPGGGPVHTRLWLDAFWWLKL